MLKSVTYASYSTNITKQTELMYGCLTMYALIHESPCKYQFLFQFVSVIKATIKKFVDDDFEMDDKPAVQELWKLKTREVFKPADSKV